MVSSPRPEHEPPRRPDPTAPRPPTTDIPTPPKDAHTETAERFAGARVVGPSQTPAVRNTEVFVQSPPRPTPPPEPVEVITERDVKEGEVLPARPTNVEKAPSGPRTTDSEARSPIAELHTTAAPTPSEPRTTDGEAHSPVANLPVVFEPTQPVDLSRFSKYSFTNRAPSPTRGQPGHIDASTQTRTTSEVSAAVHPAATDTSEAATAPRQEAPQVANPNTDLEPKAEAPQGEIPPSLSTEIPKIVAEKGQPVNLLVESKEGTPEQVGTAALVTLSSPDGTFQAQIVTEKLDPHIDRSHIMDADLSPEHIQPGRDTTHVIWIDKTTNEVGLTAWVGGDSTPARQLSVVYQLDEITPETAELPVAERLRNAVPQALTPERESALASKLAAATASYVDADGAAITMTTLPRSLPAFLAPPAKIAPKESDEPQTPEFTTEWVVNGVANPVVVTDILGTDAHGRLYVGVEGTTMGIPVDQIEASDPNAFKEMLERFVSTATTRPAPKAAATETTVYTQPAERPTRDERALPQTAQSSQNGGGSTSGEGRANGQRKSQDAKPAHRGQQKRTEQRPKPPAIDLYMKPSGRDIALSVGKTVAAGFLATLRQFFLKPTLISYETGKNGTKIHAKIRTSRGKIKEVTIWLKPGETINYKTLQRAVNGQRLRNIFVR